MSNQSLIQSPEPKILTLLTCLLLDFPEDLASKNIDCSTKDSTVCVKCVTSSSFVTGEAISDTGGIGHIIAILIWSAVIFLGFFGIVTSIIIILVYKRGSNDGKQFDFLVSFLAAFDVFVCLGGMLAATSIVACYQGWGTLGNYANTYIVRLSVAAVLFTRSLSTHLTVLINFHCYFGIACIFSSRKGLSFKWIRLFPVISLLIAIILNVPRIGILIVDKNSYNEGGHDIPVLRGLDYISFKRQKWQNFWDEIMFSLFDLLDFILPLILLGIFNVLSYWKAYELQKTKTEWSPKEEEEMESMKMFLPVEWFYLFCNVGLIVFYAVYVFKNVIYRELVISLLFCIVLHSSMKFLIFYFRGQTFRKHTNKLASRLVGKQRFITIRYDMNIPSK